MPGAGDAADVVAAEIDQHDVLGALLGVGEQLRLQARILLGAGAARPGAGDGAHLDAVLLLAHQHLGGGADHQGRAEAQEEHVGRGVDGAQGAVDVEGVGRPAAPEKRCERTTWKMSPARMYSLQRSTAC